MPASLYENSSSAARRRQNGCRTYGVGDKNQTGNAGRTAQNPHAGPDILRHALEYRSGCRCSPSLAPASASAALLSVL